MKDITIIATFKCRRCGTLPINEGIFIKNSVRGVPLYRCKTCRKVNVKNTHLRNPEKYCRQKTIDRDPETRFLLCSCCHFIKPIDTFSPKQIIKYYPTCRECIVLRRQKLREKDPELYNRRQRNVRYLKLYGITLEKYEELILKQNNKCSICSAEPDYKIETKTLFLHVDHSHTSGKVRSLLCAKCNVGLGSFSDSIEKLQAAIDYLKLHRD